ncbi:hypothetical protein [Lysinibacillus pakistanensis]|uniref:hypothetical protein n=1 Tax=Lysinibacillus pakistanensis TaxID=759811 RepID=UPI003D2E7E1F
MAVHYKDLKELQGEQADILWESLTTNPLLVRRTPISVNQQLNTKNLRTISAINEIKSQADTAKNSVVEAMNYVNHVVGDAGNPEIQAKFDDLGGNLIDAVYILRDKSNGILEEAKTYTDEKFSTVDIKLIDGGTF